MIKQEDREAVHASARKLAEESKGRADNEGFLARMYLDLVRDLEQGFVPGAYARLKSLQNTERKAEVLHAALKELVRLYDWRFELARQEGEQPKDEIRRLLLRYGREKAAAWAEAKRVLT